MKPMKKIMIMLAFCGALATMSAQTYGSDSKNKQNEMGTLGEDQWGIPPVQNGKMKVQKSEKDECTPTEKKLSHKKATKTVGRSSRSEKVKSSENTGLSTATYTHTPEPQDKTAVSVPEKVRSAFSNAYNSAKATWKTEGENFRAMFRNGDDDDALSTIIVYDKEGNILVTEMELSNKACPEEIEKFCARDSRIWKVETKDGPSKYFIQEDGETKWFDLKGERIYGTLDTHGVSMN